MNEQNYLEDVAEIIDNDVEGFWALIGEIGSKGEPRRREALMNLVVAAYIKGYEQGLHRGGKLLVEAVPPPRPYR